LQDRGIAATAQLPALCDLLKDRCDTTLTLADWVYKFYADVTPSAEDLATHLTPAVQPALRSLLEALGDCVWDKAGIAAAIKQVLTQHTLKMPQLAMPVRVVLLGTPQTPALDAVLALFDRNTVLARLRYYAD
jgi:glutamyl-tRNA synthetase